jgi:hypothetical protein
LRKLRESAIISLCAALGTPDDEALCCARLILGPKSSATEETTIDGLLRGTYRCDITSQRLSGAGHTLATLKERLQSRSFGREQLTALLSGMVLDIAREGVVRLLMASVGRDAAAAETSLRPVVFATTSPRAPSEPVVFATTAPTPAPQPQLSDDERQALTAREQSRVLLAARLLRDEFGGRCDAQRLCYAIYAADAKARNHFNKWFGGAMGWFEQFPHIFSCVMDGTTLMVSLATGNGIEEAATNDGQARDAVASSSEQPESQVAFEEPITDISLERITGGASQMIFTAGGDISLPPSVIEDFGYASPDMITASDVRTPSELRPLSRPTALFSKPPAAAPVAGGARRHRPHDCKGARHQPMARHRYLLRRFAVWPDQRWPPPCRASTGAFAPAASFDAAPLSAAGAATSTATCTSTATTSGPPLASCSGHCRAWQRRAWRTGWAGPRRPRHRSSARRSSCRHLRRHRRSEPTARAATRQHHH